MINQIQSGLQTINKIRAGIRFEIQHNYINIVGKNGDFTTFMKEESRTALKIFQHSEKWNKIYALISRYPFLDLSSRIANINHILDILLELEDYYESDIEQRNSSINSAETAEQLAILKKARDDKFKADLKNVDAEQIPVQFVKGVGQKLAEKFDKIGIQTCKDLLLYKPRDYIFFESKDLIKDLKC